MRPATGRSPAKRSPPKRASKRALGARTRPRTRRPTDERRRQLVDLGLEHFGTRPYDDVSIDDIAYAAGISKGLLYHYFATKRAFYTACVAEAAERLLAACVTTGDDLPPLDRLDHGISAYLDYVFSHGHAYAGLMRSGVGVDPKIRAIVDETRDKFVEHLLAGVGEAVELTPRMRIALRGWVGLAEAAALAWIEDGSRVPAKEMQVLLKTALLAILAPRP